MALGITNLVLLTTVRLPTADVAVHNTERWDVIPECLCCFPLPSKLIPFFKITSQKWLFHTFYCKIDLLNQNPIDQKLAC